MIKFKILFALNLTFIFLFGGVPARAQDAALRLPAGVVTSYELHDSSIPFLSVPASGAIYYRGKPVAAGDYVDLLKWNTQNDPKAPPVAYVKADARLRYEQLAIVLKRLRQNKVQNVALVVNTERIYEPTEIMPEDKNLIAGYLSVKLPAAPVAKRAAPQPNPLFLTVSADQAGGLMLNNINMSAENMQQALVNVFKERLNNGVFREGTNELLTEVHINFPALMAYGEVIRLIDQVRATGAYPVYLELEKSPTVKRNKKYETADDLTPPPPPPPPVKRKPDV